MNNFNRVRPGAVLPFMFETFAGSTGANVTMSGFAVGDIKVYKDGSTTERASTSGFTLLDSDGIDFDGITGAHGFSIDLSDNTTAGFYAAGSRYSVWVSTVTVDGQTISLYAGMFVIGTEGAIRDTTIATLASQTSFTLSAGATNDNAYKGCRVIVQSLTGASLASGLISAYTGSSKTVTLLFDPAAYTMAAGDNISILPPAFADLRQVAGTAQTAGDIVALLATLATYVDTEVAAIKAKTDNLPSDPADASVIAGRFDTVDASLTSIGAKTTNLPTDPADASVIAGRFDDLDAAVGAITTGASAPILYETPFSLAEDGAYPSNLLDIFVGATPTLVLRIRDASGTAVNLGTATVLVTCTNVTGTTVSDEEATVRSAEDGIVAVAVPASWSTTAGRYRITATVTGGNTMTAGPLRMRVRAL